MLGETAKTAREKSGTGQQKLPRSDHDLWDTLEQAQIMDAQKI